MKTRSILSFSTLLLLTIVIFSCNTYVNHSFRQSYSDVNELIHSDTTKVPFFKVHFKNGDVSVLEKWDINKNKDTIIGQGKLYDFNRVQIEEGSLSFSVDEIAIVETNQLEAIKSRDRERIAALSVLTGANVVLDVFCIANPKACFGSCPTFYVDENSSIHSANAEGFSSSTSPCFEKKDLDPLQYNTSSKAFFLTMKNEALETHMVNELSIEAVLKNKNEKVYVDKKNNYYKSNQLFRPTKATVGQKDIKSKISRLDDLEYFSTTDSTDLFAQEEIILEFDHLPKGEFGLTLNYRQTLLSTFLFYTGISYMGDEAADYVAKMETNGLMRQIVQNQHDKFGRIKLSSWDSDNKEWKPIEEFDEKGPIAKNLILAPIFNKNPQKDKLKIKLELTKGLWRLDYIGLDLIDTIANPIIIYPSEIEVIDGADYTIKDIKSDDKNYLISFPGNEFKFKFDLPETSNSQDYELFLSSKGYYLEWIRQDWIKGKNIVKLNKMLMNDTQTWTDLAKEFKTMEHEMETVFWNSKYSRIK
jgi:hypothetical protein